MSAPDQKAHPLIDALNTHAPTPAVLEEVLHLEASGTLDTTVRAGIYRRALEALSGELRQEAQGGRVRTGVGRWLLKATGLTEGPDTGVAWQEHLWDATAELISHPTALPDLLDRAAERLTPEIRPNLQSLLMARLRWRARDLQRARQQRAPEVASILRGTPAAEAAEPRIIAGLAVEGALAQLADEPAARLAVERLLLGDSVAEAARLTGLSRQAIYRRLDRVRAWMGDPSATAEAPAEAPQAPDHHQAPEQPTDG